MLHRTAQTFQRAALRRSFARQHGHAHRFRSQPSHLHTITRSVHDDSNDLPVSQTPSHRSWTDKIASLQSDTDTTKARLGDLKTSVDTRISSLQTDLKADLTVQISGLSSMVGSKIDKLESKIDKVDSKVESKIDKLESKIDTFQNEMRHNLSELRSELEKKMLGYSMESKRHEIRLIWRIVFTAIGITAVAVSGAVTMFMRDHVPLQKISHVEQAPLQHTLYVEQVPPQHIPHVEQVPLQQIPDVEGK